MAGTINLAFACGRNSTARRNRVSTGGSAPRVCLVTAHAGAWPDVLADRRGCGGGFAGDARRGPGGAPNLTCPPTGQLGSAPPPRDRAVAHTGKGAGRPTPPF